MHPIRQNILFIRNINTEGVDPLLRQDTETTTDGLAWKVKGGVTYMATQSLGINLGISYDQFSNKETVMNTEVKTNVSKLSELM
jgi:outer membrane protein